MTNEVPHYFRNLNKKLLDGIPPNLGRVLEFGCSAGMLGKAYKSMNPDTVWHGLEINSDAVKLAKQNIDGAWVGNANKLKPNKTMLKEPYDAIIYGDVIEHFIDPVECMPDHLELLRSGGEMIACIPNVQHWTLMKSVLQGNWNYRDSGLLDNTHLRFFTRKSIRKLLLKLDLTLVEQQRFSYENGAFAKRENEKKEFLNMVESMNKTLGMEFNEFDFRTFQYFIRATKN